LGIIEESVSERLRITGGTRLNKRLISPPKSTIRPASDMIRQAVFNMFGTTIVGTTFYDVFAGTGVVGIEALSRGARRAIFIELDGQYVKLLRRNLELARFGAEASVRPGDAFIWGKHFAPEEGPNIVFLGPPYPLVTEQKKRIFKLIEQITANLDEDDWLIIQIPSTMKNEELPDFDRWVRLRKYGKTTIGIWNKAGSAGSPIWTMPEEDEEEEEFEDDEDAADEDSDGDPGDAEGDVGEQAGRD
jgi:16S rRNA (guanine(966)-N(2))-methyltransferase RsmD